MRPSTLRALLAPGVLTTSLALGLTLWSPMAAEAAARATPRALVVKSTSTTSASLDWKKVAGASGYRVRYATSATMANARGAAFRYSNGVVKGLKPGTRYWFRIAVAAKHGTGAAQSAYTRAPYPMGTTKAPAPAPAPTPPSGGSGAAYDLDVASFNISGITTDSSSHEPWANRKDKVAEQLLGQDPGDQPADAPDVMALQEANNTKVQSGVGLTQYSDLVATLNRHATGTNHFSTVDPSIQSLSTRIAYNDHTLSLVKAGALKWTAQETTVDGLRYMAWGIFSVRSTGARFFFASNHLETASEPVRRLQWQQLIDDVPGLAGGLPVVFGGDFNSTRGAESRCSDLPNPTANLMLPKMAPAGFGDTLGQVRCATRATVSGARAEHVVNGNVNSVNRYTRSLGYYSNTDIVGQDVDYIFASNNLEVKDWEMVYDETPGSYSLQGVIPSDHNMIRAEIVLPGR